MPVIDTSWLVALFNETDAHHEKALRQADGASGLIIPAPVLTEFLNLVAHRISKRESESVAQKEVRRLLKSILDQTAFAIEPQYEPQKVHEIFFRHHRLDYADAVAASLAQSLKQQLFSFDRDQLKAIKQNLPP